MSIYYVKVGGVSTGAGSDPSIAWNFAKFKSTTFNPGDTILFNRGDTFTGSFKLSNGSISNPIVYGAYGTGANPIISGFVPSLTWSLYSGNIYYTDGVNVPLLQVLTVNGTITGMGRYPKNSWLIYDGSNQVLDDPATLENEYVPATEIYGSSVATIPFNATGGELVIKKQRYIIDRNPITGHSGTTLSISNDVNFGSNFEVSNNNGNGYFIQGHLSCLTQLGDWYYNKSTKRLYAHFGTGNSSSATVKASNTDIGVDGSFIQYVNISNIDFTGYNIAAISMPYSAHINITNCNITHSTDAVYTLQGNGFINIDGVNISSTLSGGIIGGFDNHDFTVNNCTLTNIAMIKGMQRSGETTGNAISINNGSSVADANILVRGNTITNVGYCGIAIYAMSGWTVENNKVDTYCTNKDDGGGLYTYGLNEGQAYTNRIIRNNIVLNGVGCYDGSVNAFAGDGYGKCFGVYLDGYSNHTEVYNNTLAHGDGGGILISPNDYNHIYNNLIYNYRYGLYIFAFTAGTRLRNNNLTNNIVIARTSTQKCIFVELYEGIGNISQWGAWSNNTYARPVDDTTTFMIDNRSFGGQIITNVNLATWKTYGLDGNSVKSQVTTTDPNKLRLDYNYSQNPVAISLPGLFKDVANTSYNGTQTLSAYSSRVTIFQSTVSARIAKSTTGKIFITNGKILMLA